MLASKDERRWLLNRMANGLASHLGQTQPPLPLEPFFQQPPGLYRDDFQLLNLDIGLWDASFVRALDGQGMIYVNPDLEPNERRFALARELFIAIATSRHGRDLGLYDLVREDLVSCANYFARVLLAPDVLLRAYQKTGGDLSGFSKTFQIPPRVAAMRWEDTLSED